METLEPDGLLTSKRIVIVGCPGAGKSTLAIQLGELLHIPVFHLDQLWWRPGWVEAGGELSEDQEYLPVYPEQPARLRSGAASGSV